MKVLMINGSPNAKGCTYTALEEVARSLAEEGIESEIIHIGNKDVRGCLGCRKCFQLGRCVIDDIVNEVAPKFIEADGIILGSPVYYASPNGTLLSFADRLFYSTFFVDKRDKVGAAVTSARRAGTTATLDVMNKYFSISGMPTVPSRYWNMVHGGNAEQARQDLEGMQIMRILGKNMAFLIKSIRLGKEQFGLPESEPITFTNFIR